MLMLQAVEHKACRFAYFLTQSIGIVHPVDYSVAFEVNTGFPVLAT